MRSHKPDPFQSLNLFNLLQKLCKSNWLIQILSIRIDILSKQHNFHNTIRHKVLNFTDDLPRLSASLPASYIRHDAVAAEIVAAKHDVDTTLKTKFTLIWQLFYNLIGIFPHIHNHLIIFNGLYQQFRKLENIVCTKDQIYETITLFDFCNNFLLLHHTAAQCNHHVWIFFLISMQITKPSVYFIVRILTNSTGIINNKIRILRFRFLIPDGI